MSQKDILLYQARAKGISRKLHELNKQSTVADPTEARFAISDKNEIQLHDSASRILERHVKDLEDFENNLDGLTRPTLTDAEQAIVDESNRIILTRFMIAFRNFSKAYVTLGNPTAEWAFWTRFLWLIEECQKLAACSIEEEKVLGAPGFFDLSEEEQDRRLKPVYDKWPKLFTPDSFKKHLSQLVSKIPTSIYEEELKNDR